MFIALLTYTATVLALIAAVYLVAGAWSLPQRRLPAAAARLARKHLPAEVDGVARGGYTSSKPIPLGTTTGWLSDIISPANLNERNLVVAGQHEWVELVSRPAIPAGAGRSARRRRPDKLPTTAKAATAIGGPTPTDQLAVLLRAHNGGRRLPNPLALPAQQHLADIHLGSPDETADRTGRSQSFESATPPQPTPRRPAPAHNSTGHEAPNWAAQQGRATPSAHQVRPLPPAAGDTDAIFQGLLSEVPDETAALVADHGQWDANTDLKCDETSSQRVGDPVHPMHSGTIESRTVNARPPVLQQQSPLSPPQPAPAAISARPVAPIDSHRQLSPRSHSVLMLGAGQFSGELVAAFQHLGAIVTVADSSADSPAHQVADRSHVLTMLDDPAELTALIRREQPEFVVTEAPGSTSHPRIFIDAISTLTEGGIADVLPTPHTSRLTRDPEALRRFAADELGLPTAPFWFAGSVDELAAIAEHAGFPLTVRPVTGMAGQGESVVARPAELARAWDRAVAASDATATTRVLVETIIEFDCQLTLLTVCTNNGPGADHLAGAPKDGGLSVQFCQPIGHRWLDSGVLQCWQPHPLSQGARDAAKSIAARVARALGGRGLYSVELRIKGDEVFFSDVSVQPCASGLVTLRSQRLSQFELHARAVLGLPVDTIMVTPGAAQVMFAPADTQTAATADTTTSTAQSRPMLSAALVVPESDVRIYGNHRSRTDQRLAVALATANDVTTARHRIHAVASLLTDVLTSSTA